MTLLSTTPDADAPDRDTLPFPVVSIEVSTGGLGALCAFFEALPEADGLAFVVIPHLAEEDEGGLADRIQAHTTTPVVRLDGSAAVEPGRIYVIPHGAQPALKGDTLVLAEADAAPERPARSVSLELGPGSADVPPRVARLEAELRSVRERLLAAERDLAAKTEATRHNEERLRLAMEAGRLGAWTLDLASGDVAVGVRIRRLLGIGSSLPLDDVLARVHPDDRAAVQAALVRACDPHDEDDALVVDARAFTGGGAPLWIAVRGRCDFEGEGSGRAPRRFIGVAIDVTERVRTQEALAALNATLEERVEERAEQVRALSAALVRAEQEERARIAQVLHDDLQQVLYGLRLKLDALRSDLVAHTRSDQYLAQRLARADELVLQALEVARTLTFDLKPPLLQDEGFEASLSWLAEHMRETHGLDVRLHVAPLRLADGHLHALLFQVVRELLFNVVKHAGVRRADVYAERDDGRIIVTVRDRGRGFDPSRMAEAQRHGRGGFGLLSIRERLALFGGQLDAVSSPGDGTRIVLTLSHPPSSSERPLSSPG